MRRSQCPAEVSTAAAAYLERFEPWTEAAEAMTAASIADQRTADTADTAGCSPPAVVAEGFVGAESTQPFLTALTAHFTNLQWQQNPTYTDESFLSRYAYCELLGPAGLMTRSTVSVGLLYLAPATMYPPHAHPAEEAYHLLGGMSEWQAGSAALTWRSPGERIEHPSGASHSMRSGPTPMLALYVWRGDLATPARFLREPH